MADAPDRPRTGGGDFAPVLPATRPGPNAVHGITTAPDAPAGPVYRPLSVAAIVGFVLAVLYSAFIVLGALFTFITGDHFLLSTWTVVLPVVVVVVCLFGRSAVQSSEGALGGLKLANWGVGLTVVCGLGYWSYYAATILALRQQAVAFVEAKFIPALTKGKVEEAFMLTFTPPRPEVAPAELRKFIEEHINMHVNRKAPGRFTMFSQTDYVRFMEMAKDATKVTLLSAGVPTVERGGMEVPLTYRVDTPVKSFDLQVVARASESPKGREWQVMENKTGTIINSISWNAEGNRLFQKNEPAAREFANSFAAKLAAQLDTEGAFLDTLPPGQRAKLKPKLKGQSEAQLIKAGENDPEIRDYLAGLKKFRAGGVIRADPNVFWVKDVPNKDIRKEIIDQVKKKFLTAFATNGWITLAGAVPVWQEKDKKLQFAYDAYIILLPEYIAGARLVVEADAEKITADAAARPEDWRVVEIEMIRCHAAPRPEAQQRGQGAQ